MYNYFFPPTCILCDESSKTEIDLCEPCFLTMPHNQNCCRTCALPLPGRKKPGENLLCGACLVKQPLMETTVAPFRYEAPSDYMVHQLKFHGSLKHGRVIGRLLANAAKATEHPQLLIPVPQHEKRLLDRGFNHAEYIAHTAGRLLSIPVNSTLVSKIDDRPPQSGLNARSRKKNMKNAFQIAGKLQASHVAIVDDVMTTGATSEALAKVLLKAGCQRVSLWTFARTE